MARPAADQFDIILFGVTGFTGNLAAVRFEPPFQHVRFLRRPFWPLFRLKTGFFVTRFRLSDTVCMWHHLTAVRGEDLWQQCQVGDSRPPEERPRSALFGDVLQNLDGNSRK